MKSPQSGKHLNTSKDAYKMNQSTVLKVIEPVIDLFRKAKNYRTYRIIKTSVGYDENVAHKLHNMANKVGRPNEGQ